MQVTKLHAEIDRLQLQYGATGLSAIYGAGCIKNPEVMLIFMNPTGKNISADTAWRGVRAPWSGTRKARKQCMKNWPDKKFISPTWRNAHRLTRATCPILYSKHMCLLLKKRSCWS